MNQWMPQSVIPWNFYRNPSVYVMQLPKVSTTISLDPQLLQQPRLQMIRKWLCDLSYIWCFKNFHPLRSENKSKVHDLNPRLNRIHSTTGKFLCLPNQLNGSHKSLQWPFKCSNLWQDVCQDWYVLKRVVKNRLQGLKVSDNQIDRPSSKGHREKRYPDFRFWRYEALRPPDRERYRTKRMHWFGR